MRVLHVIDHMGLGGAQAALLDLLEARSPEIEVELCSLSGRILPTTATRLAGIGMPYRSLGLSKLDLLGPLKLRSLLKAVRPDLLHTHLEFSNAAGAAVAASLGRSRPIVLSQVDNDPLQSYSRLHRLLGRALAPLVDMHLVAAPGLRERVIAAFGIEAGRLATIPLGLDLTRFTAPPDPHGIAELRGDAPRVVGTVGRLAPQKAVHVLLDATPALLEVERRTRVLIVGEGPLRPALEARSRRLGIDHAVTFTGYRADVEVVYAAMDAFVLPSLYEGFGLVLIEAMACGVPVVASEGVGTVDLVRDGHTGLLVPIDDRGALAASLLRLLADQDLARHLRLAARDLVHREHGRAAMTRRMESLYFDLARSPEREQHLNARREPARGRGNGLPQRSRRSRS